jgi:hypothetical protein
VGVVSETHICFYVKAGSERIEINSSAIGFRLEHHEQGQVGHPDCTKIKHLQSSTCISSKCLQEASGHDQAVRAGYGIRHRYLRCLLALFTHSDRTLKLIIGSQNVDERKKDQMVEQDKVFREKIRPFPFWFSENSKSSGEIEQIRSPNRSPFRQGPLIKHTNIDHVVQLRILGR